jgi:hypothetical protein
MGKYYLSGVCRHSLFNCPVLSSPLKTREDKMRDGCISIKQVPAAATLTDSTITAFQMDSKDKSSINIFTIILYEKKEICCKNSPPLVIIYKKETG